MNSEIKPLDVLKGMRIVDIDIEISFVEPLNSRERETQIEIPLKLIFEQHRLLIYNQWSIKDSSHISIDNLKGRVIVGILLENEELALQLDNTNEIRVNLNDNGYTGPEAMVLYGPDNSIIVWN